MNESDKNNNNIDTTKTKKEVIGPRTAYNFFYRYQRDLILNEKSRLISDNDDEKLFETYNDESRRKRPHRKTHGLISLQQLKKTVAKKWKEAFPETRNKFKRLAEEDRVRYYQEKIACATKTFVKPAVDIDGDNHDNLSQAKHVATKIDSSIANDIDNNKKKNHVSHKMVGQPDSEIKDNSDASVVHSTLGSLKRKRSNNEVEFIAKCPCREADYFFHEMEKYFECATGAAKRGDISSMLYNLSEAKKFAIKANILSNYEDRAAKVRQQHFLSKMEKRFTSATVAAKRGRQSSMRKKLSKAKNFAIKANAMSDYEGRAAKVRMESFFDSATKAAEKGKRSWVELALSIAKRLAIKSNAMLEYDKREMQIQNIFYRHEQMLKTSPITITPVRNGESRRKVQTSCNHDDDHVIEKEVGIKFTLPTNLSNLIAISNRLKETEQRVDVINIS